MTTVGDSALADLWGGGDARGVVECVAGRRTMETGVVEGRPDDVCEGPGTEVVMDCVGRDARLRFGPTSSSSCFLFEP